MVCQVEMRTIDMDERRDTPVVVRYFSQDKKFYICHEKSYQSAFRNSVNGFDTRQEAIDFAEDHDCEVTWHDYDILQSH